MAILFEQRLVLLMWLFVFSAAAQPSFEKGQPAPEMDALFQQTNGWVGADGDYSVALTPTRTLWLFSDTWIGNVRDGKRTNVTMVNNTLALQDGRGSNSKLQFIVRRNSSGKPVAFVTPEDKHGWFWLQAAVCVDNHLFLFLPQIASTGEPGAFGFRQIGQSLGIVTNPLASPLEWHIEQYKLPSFDFSSNRHRTYSAATLVDGEYLYIYGTDEDMQPGKGERYLTVARVPTNDVVDFSAWRYYADGQWNIDYHKATRIASSVATEDSVLFLPKLGKYVLVYTDHGFSPKIQIRTSSHPWGEWSAPTTVYQCPEMLKDKGVFCYTAKAQPSQGTDDTLMITYAANAFDVAHVIEDASLYWPRFVRVPLTK